MFKSMPLVLAGILGLVIASAGAAQAGSHGTRAGNLEIADAWARATPPAAPNGGAFMTIINHGMAADKLLSARTPAAMKVELHNHINDNGVMRMRQVPHIEVPGHGQAVLKPGSLHVMLMGLKAPLTEGATVALTLTFQGAGEVTVQVPVMKGAGARPMGMGGGHGMKNKMGQ